MANSLTFDFSGVHFPRKRQSRDSGGHDGRLPGLAVAGFTVVIDSSEQLPFCFSGMYGKHNETLVVPTVVSSLKTGDYSILGIESVLTVERKSASDIVRSVCRGHARLEREHQRMLSMVENGGHAALVCEGSYSEIDDQLRGEGRWEAANTLLGTMISWPCKYHCPWYFAGDRRRAEIITFRLLEKWHNLVCNDEQRKQRDR